MLETERDSAEEGREMNTTISKRTKTIRQLREQGYTLESIGSKFDITRERVRQILQQRYGTTQMSLLVSRQRFAALLGCSYRLLENLERKELVSPICSGKLRLYDKRSLGEVAELVAKTRTLKPVIELTCETCGKKFYRKSYCIRPTSSGRFCSKKCWGVYFGHNYGFGIHGKIGRNGNHDKKWDYNLIYELQDATDWGAHKISKTMRIPIATISAILAKRK